MAFDTPNVTDLKTRQRDVARRRRRDFGGDRVQAAEQAADQFLDAIHFAPQVTIAGYAAHQTELDVWPLLRRLSELGVTCCLPSVRGPNQSLAFLTWRPGMPLTEGRFEILEPGKDASVAVPDIVLTPLLAFDRRGYRLGYGGGYYDRTLRELRKQGTVRAVGFGYAFQEIDQVPVAETDERLDWVVTETETLRIEG